MNLAISVRPSPGQFSLHRVTMPEHVDLTTPDPDDSAAEDPLQEPQDLLEDSEAMAREIRRQAREVEDLRRQIQVLQLGHKVPLHPNQDGHNLAQKTKQDQDSWATIEKARLDTVGDAVGDAVMYNHRFDTTLYKKQYKELYGLGYHQVIEWLASGKVDRGLFATMNAHATLKMRNNIMTKGFETAFQDFISEVEKHWLRLPSDPKSPFWVAYDSFWKQYGQQKKLEAEARLDDFESNQ
ncbi:MAG: hypothetical protein LQ338_002991 [Usnochroma carphineum]|nr:MAG: hypothetical protein LQ338_002991 [Usnochroma carphineum]